MNERIDHAKAADDLMRKLATAPATDDAHDVEWGFREAQVHATLALVEQQRIANLISLMQMQEEIDEKTDMIAGEAMHSIIEYQRTPGTAFSDPDDVPVVRPSIRESLGLS